MKLIYAASGNYKMSSNFQFLRVPCVIYLYTLTWYGMKQSVFILLRYNSFFFFSFYEKKQKVDYIKQKK